MRSPVDTCASGTPAGRGDGSAQELAAESPCVICGAEEKRGGNDLSKAELVAFETNPHHRRARAPSDVGVAPEAGWQRRGLIVSDATLNCCLLLIIRLAPKIDGTKTIRTLSR